MSVAMIRPTETMLPWMLDCFSGRGGATKGFMAEGWQCVGVDIRRHAEYPSPYFVERDVLTITADDVRPFDFAWASSPCEGFSVHCMGHYHKNPPFPEMGIRLFEHTRNIFEQAGIDYVMENVRCAEKFVGKAVNHCGPFYLWGNAVPAVFPRHLFSIKKGINAWMPREMRKRHDPYYRTGSKSKERMEIRSMMAEIPLELSGYIARCWLGTSPSVCAATTDRLTQSLPSPAASHTGEEKA